MEGLFSRPPDSDAVEPEEASRLLVAEYERMAEAYDRYAAPYYATIADRILDLANVGLAESVLDIGCGTGNLALLAAGRVGDDGNVVGIDLAEGMVVVASTKARGLGLRNLRFEMMDVRALGFEDASFDAAVSCFGLPRVGHRTALREASRLLRPGGRFVACDWSAASAAGKAFREAMDRHVVPNPPVEVERLREARRALTTTRDAEDRRNPDTIAAILRGIGCSDARHREETVLIVFPSPDEYLAHTSAWGDNDRELRAMDEAARQAVRLEFAAAIAGSVTADGLVVEWHVRFTIARK